MESKFFKKFTAISQQGGGDSEPREMLQDSFETLPSGPIDSSEDAHHEDLRLEIKKAEDSTDIYSFLDKLETTPITKDQHVLLTFPLRPQFVGRTVDLGLGYLYSALRLAGYDVELNMMEWKEKDFREYFGRRRVDVVGIKCYGSTTAQTVKTINLIKSISRETLVLVGGPQPFGDPENILDYIPADFAFHGDCEEAIVDFMDKYFSKNGDYRQVAGLIYRDGNSNNINPLAVFSDLDRIPYPPWNKLSITIPRRVNYYYRYYPNAVMLTSRGCNMHCRFCSNPFALRLRNVEHIIQEVKYLQENYGVRELLYFDNNFNANKKHTRRLCKRLIEEDIKIPFYVTHGMRVNTIDEETVRLMKEAGCYKVSLGIESGDQEMLNYLGKGYKLSSLPQKLGILKKQGLEIQAFVMIGLPHESDRQRKNTLKVVLENPFDHVTFNIFTPYPGTAIFDELKAGGTLEKLGYDLKSYSRSQTPNKFSRLSPATLRWLNRYFFLRFYLRPKILIKTIKDIIKYPDSLVSMQYAIYKAYINTD